MLRLSLMRHAKSSWDHPELRDYDRPLNKRGRSAAPKMARHLHSLDWIPDLIISSSANRAASTAKLFVEELSELSAATSAPHLLFEKSLYHASPGDYFEAANLFGDKASHLMMIGHNPGMEELVYQLSGQYHVIPTAAIANFEIESASWSDFPKSESAKLRGVFRPKEID